MRARYFIYALFCISFILGGCNCMGGEWGFIDTKGNVVVDFKYDEVRSYSSGMAIFYKGDKAGILNYDGKEILKPTFSDISDFDGDFAYFVIRNEVDGAISESYGFINKNGQVIIEPIYKYVKYINSGISAVKNKNSSKYFLLKIDTNEKITEEIFDDIDEFSDERGIFVIQNKKGVLDTNGRIIVEAMYDDIKRYKDGYAIVKKDNFYGLIDIYGAIVLDLEYEDLSGLEKNYIVFKKNGKYGLLRLDTKSIIIEPAFDLLSAFTGLYSTFCNGDCFKCEESRCDYSKLLDSKREYYIGDSVGFINLKNEVFTIQGANILSVFTNKRAVVCSKDVSNSCYLINENIQKIDSESYDVVRDFYDGFSAVCKDCWYGYGDWWFIDYNGKRIGKDIYHSVMDFSDGFAAVKEKKGIDEWKFIDTKGIVVSDEYDLVKPFKEGRAAVCKGICERLGGGH